MNSERTDTGAQSWFRSANCDGRYGLGLAIAVLALCALSLGGEAWRSALRYERGALIAGQWWRLISAHLVHLSLTHALLNAIALVLLWVLFARDYSAPRWGVILLVSALAVDTGLWFLSSQVQWYVGASGVLHGVLAAGVYAACRRRERLGYGLALVVIAKLLYEHFTGASVLLSDLPVVPQAHVYGVCGGLIGMLLTSRMKRL